jgi:hypothetical protein
MYVFPAQDIVDLDLAVVLPSTQLTRRVTDMIDKQTKEIRQDDGKTVYKTLEEIGDDLPDHSPRFIFLSYPLTLVSPAPFLTATGELHIPCGGRTDRALR